MNRFLSRTKSPRTPSWVGWLSAFLVFIWAPAYATPSEGLVWVVQGTGGKVYIAGSMHLLRRDRPALPEAITEAYRESESLVMELDVDDINEQAMAAQMLGAASFSDGRTLPSVAGETRWNALQPVLATLQFPAPFAATLEPWGLSILLTTLEYARLGFDAEVGVEKQLQKLAAADKKAIAGLETPEFQISLFDSLPLDEQLQLLDMTLSDIAEMPTMADDLYLAWRRGDTRRLEELLLEGYKAMPKLYDDLVDQRNRRWVPQVTSLTKKSGDTLVVVGALHLVGDRGLIALLEKEGLKIERYSPSAVVATK
ncbi:MAG: TraB/GumN family protein [Gammaproteobacteria bacterium]